MLKKRINAWSVHTRRQVAPTRRGDTSAATNRFARTAGFLWKSLLLQKNFVAATSRTNSVWFDFLRLVAATKKFCCGDKDFHKTSPVHTKRFVAATYRLTVLLQLVARSVNMEWSVAATCRCNLSPSVYRPLNRLYSIHVRYSRKPAFGCPKNRSLHFVEWLSWNCSQ